MNRYKVLLENERRILTSVNRLIHEGSKLTDAEKAEREAETAKIKAEKEVEKARIKAEKEVEKANRLTAKESEPVVVDMWNTHVKGGDIPKKYAERGLEPLFNSIKPHAKSPTTVIGASDFPCSDLWKEITGKTADTSKTDIKGDKNYSVKYGPAQLMAGVPSEARATLIAAAENSGLSDKVQQNAFAILEELKKYAFRTEGETMNLKVLRSYESAEQLTNANNKKAYGIIMKGEELQKKLTQEMQTLFDGDQNFQREFIFEAMTGRSKFSDASAIADTMLCISKDAKTIKVESVIDSSSPYVAKVVSATTIKATYKGAARTNATKDKPKTITYGYDFNTALRLYTKDLTNATNECVAAINSYNGNILNENFLDYVKKAWNKLKGVFAKIKQFIVKAIEYIKTGFYNLLEFFGIDFDVEGWQKLDVIDLYDVA
jgi:hypothetical protein